MAERDVAHLGRTSKIRLDRMQVAALSPDALAALRRVSVLHLQHNRLSDVAGLAPVGATLEFLAVQHNRLTDLRGLAGMGALEYLNASHNDIAAVDPAELPPGLRVLRLRGNPVVEGEGWGRARLALVAHLTELEELNDEEIHRADVRLAREALGLPEVDLPDTDSDEGSDAGGGGGEAASAGGGGGAGPDAAPRMSAADAMVADLVEMYEGMRAELQRTDEALRAREAERADPFDELGREMREALSRLAADGEEREREHRELVERAAAMRAELSARLEESSAEASRAVALAKLAGGGGQAAADHVRAAIARAGRIAAEELGPAEAARPAAGGGGDGAGEDGAGENGAGEDGQDGGAAPGGNRLPKGGLSFLDWE